MRSWGASVAADEINYQLTDIARVVHLTVYLVCTDAGPDEAGTKTIVLGDTAALLTTWVVWTFCFIHQLHLIIKRQIVRADASRLFGNTAMMTNVWRSPAQATIVFRGWADVFGIPRARAVASRGPPRCLKGRRNLCVVSAFVCCQRCVRVFVSTHAMLFCRCVSVLSIRSVLHLCCVESHV